MEYNDLEILKSYAYSNTNIELVEKIEKEMEQKELIEELEEYIDNKYKQGYNYLDIAKDFPNKDYLTINDDFFLVYVKNLIIMFEHSTYSVLIKG
jgi:hypothetical protein